MGCNSLNSPSLGSASGRPGTMGDIISRLTFTVNTWNNIDSGVTLSVNVECQTFNTPVNVPA